MPSDSAESHGNIHAPDTDGYTAKSWTKAVYEMILDMSIEGYLVFVSAILLLLWPILDDSPLTTSGRVMYVLLSIGLFVLWYEEETLQLFARQQPDTATELIIRSSEDIALALLSSRKVQSLLRALLKDPDVRVDAFKGDIMRIIQHLGHNLVAEHEDQAIIDIATVMQTEQGSRDTALSVLYALVNNRTRRSPNPRLNKVRQQIQGLNLDVFFEVDSRYDVTIIIARDLLTDSDAYQTFKADCLRAAHTPYEKRILRAIGERSFGETGVQLEPIALQQVAHEVSWTPPHGIRVSKHDDQSLTDQMKAIAEDYFGPTWNWWPLTSRRYPLRRGYRRIDWSSPCGTTHHFDIPWTNALSFLGALNSVPGFMETDFLADTFSNSLEELIRESLDLTGRISDQFERFLGVRSNPSDQPSASPHSRAARGRDPSSRNQAGASSNRSNVRTGEHRQTSSRRRSDAERARRRRRDNENTVASTLGVDGRTPPSHVYLCTQRGNGYRPTDIECDSGLKDRAFFQELKAHYIASRGFWRYYLSMWKFDHCEFYRISKYGRNACSPLAVGFPSEHDKDYEFAPRPPSPGPPHGPITETEFRDRFYKSGEKYFSWQNKWESTFYENDDWAYKALPKRMRAVALDNSGREFVYGLYAKEKRSFARFIAYLFLCFLIPGGVFFCVYLARRGKASELPSAGWPITTALALGAILMAELIHSREDGRVPPWS